MPSPNSAWPGAAISICACALKSQIQLYVEFKWWILVTTPEVRKFRCDDKRGGTATFRAQTTFVNSVCAEHVSARGGQPSAVGPWLAPAEYEYLFGNECQSFPWKLIRWNLQNYKLLWCVRSVLGWPRGIRALVWDRVQAFRWKLIRWNLRSCKTFWGARTNTTEFGSSIVRHHLQVLPPLLSPQRNFRTSE